MLQIIRERLTGWFAITILGVIALTLVLTFSSGGFTGAGAAASVNGEDIPMRDFQRIYQRQRQQWESNYRAQIPAALATDMANQIVQSLVRNRVVAQYVRDQGYRVNDDEIIAVIEAAPAFQVGGRFSQPSYKQILASEGMTTQRYEYEQRQNMEMSQLIEGLGYTAFYTPTEFRRYIELDGETRDIEYLILPALNWIDAVGISPEQVSDYYELNQRAFMTEESVTLEYIEVDYNHILTTITLSGAEVQAYYDTNPQEFNGPEERNVSHILIAIDADEEAAAAQAEALKLRLASGEAFDALAAQYSADTGSAGNGGNLGWLGAGDAPAPEFEDALFALQEGEVSIPVRTEFGFHLIRLDRLRLGTTQSFNDVREDLEFMLRENAAADVYAERIDELDERALESMDGLASVAEALEVELGTVESFTRSGGLPLGLTPDLTSAVFSLEVLEDGENSPVIDLGEGRAVVVRVVEHRPSEVRVLELVSDEIIEQLQAEESIALAAEAGTKMLARLNEGSAPDELALPSGVQWQQAEQIRRGAQKLPVDLAAAIFRAPKPDALLGPGYQGLWLASGDFAVFRITASQPGRPELYSQEDRDLRKQQLAGKLGGSQAAALVEALVSRADIGIVGDLLGTEGNLQ